MEIITNNRLNARDGEDIRFGGVVTLKEIKGVNRIEEFIRNCTLANWIVNEVIIDNRLEIHETINEEVELE